MVVVSIIDIVDADVEGVVMVVVVAERQNINFKMHAY